MSEVLSIRIPKELKKELDELREFIDIKKEVIEFLNKRVREYRRLRTLKEVHEALERHPILLRGTAAKSVREDRDSH